MAAHHSAGHAGTSRNDRPNATAAPVRYGTAERRSPRPASTSRPALGLAATTHPHAGASRAQVISGDHCRSDMACRYAPDITPVSYTHLRAHETPEHLVCR